MRYFVLSLFLGAFLYSSCANAFSDSEIYDVINDEETIDAFFRLSRLEGIIPAIESSHAVAYGMKLAKTMEHGSILINLSGRGDKDMDYILENYGIRDIK